MPSLPWIPLSLIWPLMLIGIGCWYFLTMPQRKSGRILRRLNQDIGGTYNSSGTLISRAPSAHLPNLHQPWQLSIQPVGLVNISMRVRWTVPWPAENLCPFWHVPSQQLVICDKSSGEIQRQVSVETAKNVAYFLRYPGFSDTQIQMTGDHLTFVGLVPMSQWQQLNGWLLCIFAIASSVAAESSTEIAFVQSTISSGTATGECPVCGEFVDEYQRIHCASCGAPHHLDCWQYNQSCAIFGCKNPHYVRHQSVVVSSQRN